MQRKLSFDPQINNQELHRDAQLVANLMNLQTRLRSESADFSQAPGTLTDKKPQSTGVKGKPYLYFPTGFNMPRKISELSVASSNLRESAFKRIQKPGFEGNEQQ